MRRLVLYDSADLWVVVADLEGRRRDDEVGGYVDSDVLRTRSADDELLIAGEVTSQLFGEPPPLAIGLTLVRCLPCSRGASCLLLGSQVGKCEDWATLGSSPLPPSLGVEKVPVEAVGHIELVSEDK